MTTEAPVAPEPGVAEPVTKKQKLDEGNTEPAKAAPEENGSAEPMKVVEATKEVEPIKEAPAAEPAAAPAKEAETKDAPAPAAAEEKAAEPKPTGWEGHTMNVNSAIDKESEGKFLSDLATAEVSVLQGIGAVKGSVCEALGVKTVGDLAEYPFYKMAKVSCCTSIYFSVDILTVDHFYFNRPSLRLRHWRRKMLVNRRPL